MQKRNFSHIPIDKWARIVYNVVSVMEYMTDTILTIFSKGVEACFAILIRSPWVATNPSIGGWAKGETDHQTKTKYEII